MGGENIDPSRPSQSTPPCWRELNYSIRFLKTPCVEYYIARPVPSCSTRCGHTVIEGSTLSASSLPPLTIESYAQTTTFRPTFRRCQNGNLWPMPMPSVRLKNTTNLRLPSYHNSQNPSLRSAYSAASLGCSATHLKCRVTSKREATILITASF